MTFLILVKKWLLMRKSHYASENKCHIRNRFTGINVKLFANTIAKMTNMCYNTFEIGGVVYASQKNREENKWMDKK